MNDIEREFEHKGHKYEIKTNRHHGTEMISFRVVRDDGEKLMPETLLLPYDPMLHGKDEKALGDMIEIYIKSR